jgi:T5SS/PEP-CTERM-associated repeat protein
MARGSWLVSILLLVAAPAAAGGPPIPPGISGVQEQLSASAEAQFDLDGDGFFDAGEKVVVSSADPAETSVEAVAGPVEGSVVVSHTVSLSGDARSLTVTLSIDCRAERPAAGDVFEDFGFAQARGIRAVGFLLGGAGRYQVSGSAAGSPPHVDGQAFRTSSEVRFGSSLEVLGQAVGNHPLSGIPESFADSGSLEPGRYYVSVSCETAAPRQIGASIDAPLGQSSAQVSLTVSSGECVSDVLTWVGGRAGAFGVAENWDPPRVPLFDEDAGRCDEVAIRGGRGLVIDLDAAAPALAAAAAPIPVRRINRLTVDAHRELQPVDGTIEGVELSPVAGERSVEVINGGSLLLSNGGVLARHLGVGSTGTGAIEVAGTGGYLETTGRLGLGIEGSGHLLVRDGATVISGEAVLGESEAQGSAVVQGAASTWNTGNLAVGLEDDGALVIEAGGVVTSETGVIGFDLDGDERGKADVTGASSLWTLDSLEVRPRGSLDLFDGGRVTVNGPLSIGAEGAAADCEAERACVTLVSGVLEAAGAVVGDGGGGELVVGPSARVAASGSFVIGTGDHSSEVRIRGNAGGDSAFTDLAIATAAGASGRLEVGSGGRLDLLGRFRVGGPPDASAFFGIFGDPADPEATQVSALDATGADSLVGGPTVSPLGSGQLQLENAVLEIFGNGHDLVIERNGLVNGGGGRIVFDAGGQLVNRGSLVGGFVIEGDYVQEEGAFLNASLLVVPAASAAAGARSLAAAPPPPPFQPLVVTGDAALDGKAVLQFGNGAAPRQGDQVELLQVSGDVTGAFDEVEVKGLAPGTFDFDATILGGSVVLTSLTDAEPLPFVNLSGKPLLLESRKGAKVKLTRGGDTSAPLTVAYAVGGTAENGVDFVELPGTIEFPARKKSVTLLVQPIADGVAEGSETIELSLAPNESFAPGLASTLTLELRDGK